MTRAYDLDFSAGDVMHVGIVWSNKEYGAFFKLYIDGSEVVPVYITDTPISNAVVQIQNVITNCDYDLELCRKSRRPDGASRVYDKNGRIDNLKIWNYAKSDFSDRFNEGTVPGKAELVLYYTFDKDEGGVVTDLSGGGHAGVVHNASWVSKGVTGGAMSFNGKTDYISTTRALDRNDDLTIAMWIYSRNTSAPPEGHRILYSQSPVPSTSRMYHGYGFFYNGSVLGYDGGYPPASHHIDAKDSVVRNRWQFVVVTRSGDKVVHYLNGVRNGTGVADTYNGSEISDLATIGARVYSGAPHQFFDDLIDDLRIYNGALSANEVKELFEQARL
jgi:hypothetical protein